MPRRENYTKCKALALMIKKTTVWFVISVFIWKGLCKPSAAVSNSPISSEMSKVHLVRLMDSSRGSEDVFFAAEEGFLGGRYK